MPTYRCTIRGENFPFRISGRVRPTGFYTTRWVNASAAEAAELKALGLLRKDKAFVIPACLRTEAAMVYFERIDRVSAASKRGRANSGFVFFPM